MATVHVTTPSRLSTERLLAAGYDFSARRAEVFPAVSTKFLEVHELDEASADVTEGTSAGVGVNWERCRYDWSTPGSVTATVTDSNVYEPGGSSWELRATPTDDGSARRDDLGARVQAGHPRTDLRDAVQAGRQADLHT